MAGVECGGGELSLSNPNEVMIRVRTGWNGLHPLKSLMVLHDKTESFNVDMTWKEAFQLKFGMTVDSEQFLIMRGQQAGGPSPVRHILLEKISVLIGDFVGKHPEFYKVFVVANELYGNIKQGNDISPMSSPMPILTSEPMPTPTSRKAPTPAVSSSSKIFANSNREVKVKGPPPDFGYSRSKRDSTNFNSIATRNAVIGNGKNFDNPGTSKRKRTPSVEGPVTPPMATATASSSEAALDAYLKEYNESCGVVDIDNSFRIDVDDSNDEVEVDDNDDVRSEISQDSQLGDLHDLGIANQDIRTDFTAKAKRNYTNSQFLMSRHELRMLKAKKTNRWAKWTLAAPIATNIIRDLLGV